MMRVTFYSFRGESYPTALYGGCRCRTNNQKLYVLATTREYMQVLSTIGDWGGLSAIVNENQKHECTVQHSIVQLCSCKIPWFSEPDDFSVKSKNKAYISKCKYAVLCGCMVWGRGGWQFADQVSVAWPFPVILGNSNISFNYIIMIVNHWLVKIWTSNCKVEEKYIQI